MIRDARRVTARNAAFSSLTTGYLCAQHLRGHVTAAPLKRSARRAAPCRPAHLRVIWGGPPAGWSCGSPGQNRGPSRPTPRGAAERTRKCAATRRRQMRPRPAEGSLKPNGARALLGQMVVRGTESLRRCGGEPLPRRPVRHSRICGSTLAFGMKVPAAKGCPARSNGAYEDVPSESGNRPLIPCVDNAVQRFRRRR
jgi:hypothetical protein